MIVVVGRVQSDPEKRDALIRIGQAVAKASREEPGCISYRVYRSAPSCLTSSCSSRNGRAARR